MSGEGIAERLAPIYQGEIFPGGCKVTERTDVVADPGTPDLDRHAARTLGLETIITSTPWFGRTPDTVRQAGAAVTEAFIQAVLS